MAVEKPKGDPQEPSGLGEHNRGVTGERAHEQGWGLNEEEREKGPEGHPEFYGGKGYDYGSAEDFGDTAVKREEGEGTEESRREKG
jgi:hypothetical protein